MCDFVYGLEAIQTVTPIKTLCMCMLVLSVECSGLLAAMMKGNKQIAIATLLVLAVILTLRECSGQGESKIIL